MSTFSRLCLLNADKTPEVGLTSYIEDKFQSIKKKEKIPAIWNYSLHSLKMFQQITHNDYVHNYLTVEGPYISRSNTNIIIDSLCYNFIFQLTQFKSCTARGGRYVHTKTSQKVIHIIMSLYCPGWNHCPRCLMLRDTFSFSTTDWDVLEGWPRALSDNRQPLDLVWILQRSSRLPPHHATSFATNFSAIWQPIFLSSWEEGHEQYFQHT